MGYTAHLVNIAGTILSKRLEWTKLGRSMPTQKLDSTRKWRVHFIVNRE